VTGCERPGDVSSRPIRCVRGDGGRHFGRQRAVLGGLTAAALRLVHAEHGAAAAQARGVAVDVAELASAEGTTEHAAECSASAGSREPSSCRSHSCINDNWSKEAERRFKSPASPVAMTDTSNSSAVATTKASMACAKVILARVSKEPRRARGLVGRTDGELPKPDSRRPGARLVQRSPSEWRFRC
jgi:hypothetical protein